MLILYVDDGIIRAELYACFLIVLLNLCLVPFCDIHISCALFIILLILKGSIGDIGISGVMGEPGRHGKDGHRGLDGLEGARGLPGLKGDPNFGLPGPNGVSGM